LFLFSRNSDTPLQERARHSRMITAHGTAFLRVLRKRSTTVSCSSMRMIPPLSCCKARKTPQTFEKKDLREMVRDAGVDP